MKRILLLAKIFGRSFFYIRLFCVLDRKTALSLRLQFKCNIYGDDINRLNARSIWSDEDGYNYRVSDYIELEDQKYYKPRHKGSYTQEIKYKGPLNTIHGMFCIIQTPRFINNRYYVLHTQRGIVRRDDYGIWQFKPLSDFCHAAGDHALTFHNDFQLRCYIIKVIY